jgi:hypothetical protein
MIWPFAELMGKMRNIQENLVNSKRYKSKFCDNSNFCLKLGPKEEKFIQIYLVISRTLIIHNSKEKSSL